MFLSKSNLLYKALKARDKQGEDNECYIERYYENSS